MKQRPATALAMKQALDDRLRSEATRRGTTLETLRTKLVLERFLARLFAQNDAPWLLKGGLAFELRFRPRARATKDVDLALPSPRAGAVRSPANVAEIREALQLAAERDLGDFLRFVIGASQRELHGPPEGGATFPVTARLAEREFARFHVDVGFGDALVGEPEELRGEDFLAFAGIAPARALAISKPQQFAEKLHAYTFPWEGRENRRVKDLVDMVLLIERGALTTNEVRAAVAATFKTRARQAVPGKLTPPPPSWIAEYAALAAEADVSANELNPAFERLSEYWDSIVK